MYFWLLCFEKDPGQTFPSPHPPGRRLHTSARRVTRRRRNRVSENASISYHCTNVFLNTVVAIGFWGSRSTSLSLPLPHKTPRRRRTQASTRSNPQTRSHAEASVLRHSYGSSLRRLVSAPLAIKSPILLGGAGVLQNKSKRCFHWTRRRS